MAYINSDNTSTFKGGYVNQSGTTIFGTFEGNVTALSTTANIGTGNILATGTGQTIGNAALVATNSAPATASDSVRRRK